MAIIPGIESVSGPSVRPAGPARVADTSAIGRGAQDLAQGIRSLGDDIERRTEEVYRRQRVADVARADAAWMAGANDLGSSFDKDTQFKTFEERAQKGTADLKGKAAALIRDEATRA